MIPGWSDDDFSWDFSVKHGDIMGDESSDAPAKAKPRRMAIMQLGKLLSAA